MRVLYNEKRAVRQLLLSYKLDDLKRIPWQENHTKWNGITVTRFLKIKRFISTFSRSQYYMGVVQNMVSISTPQTFIIIIYYYFMQRFYLFACYFRFLFYLVDFRKMVLSHSILSLVFSC